MPALRGYDALEDRALVALVAEGDGAALEALFGRYGRPCYALARHILAADRPAQAVVEEVFLDVWRDAVRPVATGAGLAGWLLSMTHRKAVDAVRREESPRQRRASAELAAVRRAEAPVPDDEVWSMLRGERIRAALAELPDAEREALVLTYFGGYTQRETAQLTDTPLGTVKARMLAGVRALRDALEVEAEVGDEPPGGPAR